MRRLGGLLGQARDFHGGMLVRCGARDQVEVLIVVGRHPVGSLPVPSRGLGGRHLRRQRFKRLNPGRSGVPGYRYRAILGNQDGGCHRPRRAPGVARHEIKQQLGDLAQRYGDLPFVLLENRFRHGPPQVARVNARRHDGRDRTLGALQQLPALEFQRERRDDLVPVADLA